MIIITIIVIVILTITITIAIIITKTAVSLLMQCSEGSKITVKIQEFGSRN
jgi:hypothetical protein